MEGGGRSIYGNVLVGCWGLRVEVKVRFYEVVVFIFYFLVVKNVCV